MSPKLEIPMLCSVCSSPAVNGDLCTSCASKVETCAPASLDDLKTSTHRRYWIDRANEGDERARVRCIRKGWIVEEVEAYGEENYEERRMEVFCGARMGGASMEAAWQEVDALG